MKKIFTGISFTVILITSIVAQIPTNGLVAWYPFSNNANDLSGNNLNGIVHGVILTVLPSLPKDDLEVLIKRRLCLRKTKTPQKSGVFDCKERQSIFAKNN